MIRSMIKKALGMENNRSEGGGGLARPAGGSPGGLVQMGKKPSVRKREGLPLRAQDKDVAEWLNEVIAANPVLIFMKGSPSAPMCGFSAKVIEVFTGTGASFQTYNILEDPGVRAGIKTYNNWPTIPQIFVGGEFIGGCDIVVEMAQNGELATALSSVQPSADQP